MDHSGSITMDLHSHRIVGWAFDIRADTELVIQALQHAYRSRQPGAGLMFHSDQYASDEYQALLKQHHMIYMICMYEPQGKLLGQFGDGEILSKPEDGACLTAPIRQSRRGTARRDINQYIVSFHNAVRLHSTLGYLSRTAYEAKPTVKDPIGLSEII